MFGFPGDPSPENPETDHRGRVDIVNTINKDVLREVAASMVNEVPDQATVHTVKIELNGQHGGVDVIVGMSLPWNDDYTKTWEVH